jgi:hypothetical protein
MDDTFVADGKWKKQPERYVPLLSEHHEKNGCGGIRAAAIQPLYKNNEVYIIRKWFL